MFNVLIDGLISIEPTILENGMACCCASCPQFGYPDGNGTAQCCQLTEGDDTACEPYYLKRIMELEAEVECLKTKLIVAQDQDKSSGYETWCTPEIREQAMQYMLDADAAGLDGLDHYHMFFRDAKKKFEDAEVEQLNKQNKDLMENKVVHDMRMRFPTAEQERKKIVALLEDRACWLQVYDNFSASEKLYDLASYIKNGKHWPTEKEEEK